MNSLNEIMAECKLMVERNPGKLKSVFISAASNSAQLLQELTAATGYPLAAICFSGFDVENRSVEAKVRIAVIVADKFQRSTGDKAAGIIDLAEQVGQKFTGHEQWQLSLTSIVPVEGTDLIAAYAVNVELQGVI